MTKNYRFVMTFQKKNKKQISVSSVFSQINCFHERNWKPLNIGMAKIYLIAFLINKLSKQFYLTLWSSSLNWHKKYLFVCLFFLSIYLSCMSVIFFCAPKFECRKTAFQDNRMFFLSFKTLCHNIKNPWRNAQQHAKIIDDLIAWHLPIPTDR